MATKSNNKIENLQDIYLEELEGVEVLIGDERLKAVEKIYKDKALATEKIPLMYLRDVVDIARLYEGQGVYSDDLIGEGNIALIMGASNLDLCESAQEVEEFLTRTVMDAMEKLISEQSSEEDIDNRIAERVNNVYEAAKEMSETLLRKVSVSELAQEMEIDEGTIYEAIRLSGNQIEYIEGDFNEN